MRNSNAETVVRQVLLDNVGPSLDQALFSNAAAVPDLRPAGLLNGIAALTPSAATVKVEAIANDLAALAASVAPVAGNSPIVLIAAPQQAVALWVYTAVGLPTLTLFPTFMSAALPAKRVIAVAVNALVSAFGVPVIDASRDAAIHEAAPASELADIGGILATPIKSMTQIDGVALRLRMPAAWALRSPTGLAWMDNVTW
jgi:hypothetical protein